MNAGFPFPLTKSQNVFFIPSLWISTHKRSSSPVVVFLTIIPELDWNGVYVANMRTILVQFWAIRTYLQVIWSFCKHGGVCTAEIYHWVNNLCQLRWTINSCNCWFTALGWILAIIIPMGNLYVSLGWLHELYNTSISMVKEIRWMVRKSCNSLSFLSFDVFVSFTIIIILVNDILFIYQFIYVSIYVFLCHYIADLIHYWLVKGNHWKLN